MQPSQPLLDEEGVDFVKLTYSFFVKLVGHARFYFIDILLKVK